MTPFLIDHLNETYRNQGCCKFQLFEPEELSQFKEESLLLVNSLKDKKYKRKFNSISHSNEDDVRKQSIDLINHYFVPKINTLIKPEFEVLPGVHLIKPRGLKTKLGQHQDSAIVNELNSETLSVWMPLQNTDKWNGTLSIVPGSHLLNNYQRGPTVPNSLLSKIKNIDYLAIPINLKAGEAFFFHSATFHGSSRNLKGPNRLAVNAIVKKKTDDLIYYFYKNNSVVEMYKIDLDYYKYNDIYSQPNKTYSLVKEEKWQDIEVDINILKNFKLNFS